MTLYLVILQHSFRAPYNWQFSSMLITVGPDKEAHDGWNQGLYQGVPLDVTGRGLFDANFECCVPLHEFGTSRANDSILIHADCLNYEWIHMSRYYNLLRALPTYT